MHNNTLDDLIHFIAQTYKFDATTYPELEGATDQALLNFAVRHSALHASKTTGQLAAMSEDIDHGSELSQEVLRENVVRSLINTLRLAELCGMRAQELDACVRTRLGGS